MRLRPVTHLQECRSVLVVSVDLLLFNQNLMKWKWNVSSSFLYFDLTHYFIFLNFSVWSNRENIKIQFHQPVQSEWQMQELKPESAIHSLLLPC